MRSCGNVQIIETCGLQNEDPRHQSPEPWRSRLALPSLCLPSGFRPATTTLRGPDPRAGTALQPQGVRLWSYKSLGSDSRPDSSPCDGQDLLNDFTHRIILRPEQMARYSGEAPMHLRKEGWGSALVGGQGDLDDSQGVCISCLTKRKGDFPRVSTAQWRSIPAPTSDRWKGALTSQWCHHPLPQALNKPSFQEDFSLL